MHFQPHFCKKAYTGLLLEDFRSGTNEVAKITHILLKTSPDVLLKSFYLNLSIPMNVSKSFDAMVKTH